MADLPYVGRREWVRKSYCSDPWEMEFDDSRDCFGGLPSLLFPFEVSGAGGLEELIGSLDIGWRGEATNSPGILVGFLLLVESDG
jgi:hypothetical protein